eukprot:3479754-Ditylum_brightwellii.AAC.1
MHGILIQIMSWSSTDGQNLSCQSTNVNMENGSKLNLEQRKLQHHWNKMLACLRTCCLPTHNWALDGLHPFEMAIL